MSFVELQIGVQRIRHEPVRTELAYQAIRTGDADRCGCIYCQNFAAQRAAIYPAPFLRLLHELGIDPSKEGEIYELDGSYGGWFYLVGEVLSGPADLNGDPPSRTGSRKASPPPRFP